MLKRVLGQAAVIGGKVIGRNTSPTVTVQGIGKKFEVPVEPHFEKTAFEEFKKLSEKFQADLGAPEPTVTGSEIQDMRQKLLQAHFEGGAKAMQSILEKEGNGRQVTGVIAGSGNDKHDAENLVNIMDKQPDSIKLSGTSGGWVQNVTRGMSDVIPDSGSQVAAFQQGMLAKAAEFEQNKVNGAYFSQGGHAARDAQDALDAGQLARVEKFSHTTLGSSTHLRVDSTALKGKYDPVPLAAELDPLASTPHGKQTVIATDHRHDGKLYAEQFNLHIMKPSQPKEPTK